MLSCPPGVLMNPLSLVLAQTNSTHRSTCLQYSPCPGGLPPHMNARPPSPQTATPPACPPLPNEPLPRPLIICLRARYASPLSTAFSTSDESFFDAPSSTGSLGGAGSAGFCASSICGA